MLSKRGRTLRSHPLQLSNGDGDVPALEASSADGSHASVTEGTASTQPPSSSSSSSSGGTLDDDCLVEVLRVAQTAGTLSLLASTSRHTCSLARSRMPLHLRIHSKAQASLILRSQAAGRPPFSGCTQLTLEARDAISCCMAAGVLAAARQWPGLQQLHLSLPAAVLQQDPGGDLDALPRIMDRLSALPHLRDMQLELPALDHTSATMVLGMTQLTGLQLTWRPPVAAPAPETGAAAACRRVDLSSVSHLTNLRALKLGGMPAVYPAAAVAAGGGGRGGGGGPYCLPSSITRLVLDSGWYAAPMACWLTHLPGCPHLQHLHLQYGPYQHPSAHPRALAPLLARHNPQLRTWIVDAWTVIAWDVPVAGLPAGAEPASWDWRPDAALSALAGLECLRGRLCVHEGVHWEHLAAAPALTKLGRAYISFVPPQQAGTTLGVLELEDCVVYMDGYGLGLLLLACPLLRRAEVTISSPAGGSAPQASGPRLSAHPRLQSLILDGCGRLQAAATTSTAAAAAAGGFDALAPVLEGVGALTLRGWQDDSNQAYRLPDLSACTALTSLKLHFSTIVPKTRGSFRGPAAAASEWGAFKQLLAPLMQLQQLEVSNALRLDPGKECEMRQLLPQLERVQLWNCGGLLPPAARTVQQ